VFSSIHTSDVMTTLRRVLSFFPAEEETQVRDRLADNLQAIVSLRLLPNKKGTGRVPAVEVMRITRTLRECIRDAQRTVEMPEHIEKGRDVLQMQTFDQHLLDLYQAGKIRLETARDAASNPRDFVTKLTLEGGDAIEEESAAAMSVEAADDERF
jgi:twitching motility protein PilT